MKKIMSFVLTTAMLCLLLTVRWERGMAAEG